MLYFYIGPLKYEPMFNFIYFCDALAGNVITSAEGMSFINTGKFTPSAIAYEV